MTLHNWRIHVTSLQATASRHFGRLVLARRWGKRSPRNTRLRSDNCLSFGFGFGLVVDSAEPKAAAVRLVAYAANARSRCACHADGRAVRRQFVASCLLCCMLSAALHAVLHVACCVACFMLCCMLHCVACCTVLRAAYSMLLYVLLLSVLVVRRTLSVLP